LRLYEPGVSGFIVIKITNKANPGMSIAIPIIWEILKLEALDFRFEIFDFKSTIANRK